MHFGTYNKLLAQDVNLQVYVYIRYKEIKDSEVAGLRKVRSSSASFVSGLAVTVHVAPLLSQYCN